MLAVEFLIFIIVFINYIVKKDLFLSTVLGMSLTIMYLIVLGNLPLDIILYKTSIVIFLKVFFVFFLVISFRTLYVGITKRGIKNDLIRLFDIFFEDKKTKIMFLLIASVLFYKVPLIGVILLIFLSLVMNFNKITAVFMPFVLISSLVMANAYIKVFLLTSGKIIYLQYIFMFYILMFVVVIFERLMKNYKLSLFDTFKEFIFYFFFLFLNIAIFLFLDYLYSPTSSLIVSMIIINLTMIATLRHYKFFIIKEIEEETPVSDIFNNLKLPYLTFIIMFIVYLLTFMITTISFFLGAILFIIINLFISNKLLKVKEKYQVIEILKLFFIFVLSGIILIIIRYENINIDNLFARISDFYLLKSNQMQNVLFISQNFTFIPNIGTKLSDLTSALDYNEFWRVKVYLLIEIQMLMSFISIYIVGFIFKVEKRNLFFISLILMAASLIFQMILYIY